MLFALNIQMFGKTIKDRKINFYLFLGALVKLFAILFFTRSSSQDLIGFLDFAFDTLSFDPWLHWFEKGNKITAFPYGPSMLVYFAPFFIIGKYFSLSSSILYGLALFTADLLILKIVSAIALYRNAEKLNFIKLFYWFFPLNFIVVYVFGFNDFIPVLFLLLSLYFLQKEKFTISYLFYFIAILSKVSVLITIPFLLIYCVKRKQIRYNLSKNLVGYFLAGVLPIFFIFYSDGLYLLLTKSKELDKLFTFQIKLKEITYFIIPVILGLIAFWTYRLRSINLNLIFATITASFFLILIFTPSSPGWIIWASPFIALISYQKDKYSSLIFIFFCILYTVSIFINNFPEIFIINDQNLILLLNKPKALVGSGVMLLAIILIYLILEKSRYYSDPFKINFSPILIAVAGDSSTGKDTLVDSLQAILVDNSSEHISGDDYHLWDRTKSNWEIITHLNPLANNLFKLSTDLYTLKNFKPIFKRHYDHSNGKMTRLEKIKPKEIIFSSGLHTLYIPVSESLFDLTVFVEMKEELRILLKVKRDVLNRGKSIDKVLNSIEIRKDDSINYIQNQKEKADISFKLDYQGQIENYENHNINEGKIKLVTTINKTFNIREIHQVLVGVLGLNCSLKIVDINKAIIEMDCMVSADQIALAAKLLLKDTFSLFKTNIIWENGSKGLIQLLLLNQLEKQRKYKIIKL